MYYKTIIAQLEEIVFIKNHKPEIKVEGLLSKQGKELDHTIDSFKDQEIRDRQPVRHVTFKISGYVKDPAPYIQIIYFKEDDLLVEGSLMVDYKDKRMLGRLRTKRVVVSTVISQHIKDKRLIPFPQNETDLVLCFESPVKKRTWNSIELKIEEAVIWNERYDMDFKFSVQNCISNDQLLSHRRWIDYRVKLLYHDRNVINPNKKDNVSERRKLEGMIERFSEYMSIHPDMTFIF